MSAMLQRRSLRQVAGGATLRCMSVAPYNSVSNFIACNYYHTHRQRQHRWQQQHAPHCATTATSLTLLILITSTSIHWGWSRKKVVEDGKQTKPNDSNKPTSPNDQPQYHPSINIISTPIPTLTAEQSQAIQQTRQYLQDYLQTYNTLEDRDSLASNSATAVRHWSDGYTRRDIYAIRKKLNPSTVSQAELNQLEQEANSQQPTLPQHSIMSLNAPALESHWPPPVEELSDHTILRYLQARNGSIDKAAKSLAKTIAWRQVFGVYELASLPYTPCHTLLHALTVATTHPRTTDSSAQPIYIDNAGAIDASKFSKLITSDEVLASHVWQMEHIQQRMQAANAQRAAQQQPPQLVDKIVQVHDLRGLTFAHRHLIKHFTATSTIDSTFYPEVCGIVYLINAPSFFASMYNTIIKPLLPSATAAKIRIYGTDDNYTEDLCQQLGIENVPREYGGMCKCHVNGCIPPLQPLTADQEQEYVGDRLSKGSWW